MHQQIDKIKKVRSFLLKLVEEKSLEQLNAIPDGFNNNILWNLGHLVASQQGLCYVRANLTPVVEESFLAKYRPSTKPEGFAGQEEVDLIRSLLFSTLDKLEVDFQNHIFTNYTAFTTRYDVTISSVEEAIDFLFFHEGLHLGVVMSLCKLVKR